MQTATRWVNGVLYALSMLTVHVCTQKPCLQPQHCCTQQHSPTLCAVCLYTACWGVPFKTVGAARWHCLLCPVPYLCQGASHVGLPV